MDPPYLNSTLDGNKGPASRPGHCTPGSQWIRGFWGHTIWTLSITGNFFVPLCIRTEAVQPQRRRYTDQAKPAPLCTDNVMKNEDFSV
jgi:hypothetical protein